MPVYYRVDSHPLLSKVQEHVRNVYVYLQDPDPKVMADRFEYFRDNLQLPEGTKRAVANSGKPSNLTIFTISYCQKASYRWVRAISCSRARLTL